MIRKSYISVAVFIFRSLFFGVGISLIFKLANVDALISCIIGTIIGLFIINITSNHHIPKFLMVFFGTFIIINYLLVFETYITSFYLYNTPPLAVNLCVMAVVIFLVYEGREVINRVSSNLFVFSAIAYILIVLALIFKIDISNFKPMFSTNIKNIMLAAFSFAITSVTPFLFLDTKMNRKEKNYGYLIASLSITFSVFIILGIIGINLINIYRYPEYMVLKSISIFSFIEKVENIFAFIWGNDIIISIAIFAHNLKKALPTKYNNLLFIIIIILTIILTSSKVIFHSMIKVFLYKYYVLILGGFIIILFISKKFLKKS